MSYLRNTSTRRQKSTKLGNRHIQRIFFLDEYLAMKNRTLADYIRRVVKSNRKFLLELTIVTRPPCSLFPSLSADLTLTLSVRKCLQSMYGRAPQCYIDSFEGNEIE